MTRLKHALAHTHTNHFTLQKHKYTLGDSRDTKMPPIRRATEQPGWYLEQTHTCAAAQKQYSSTRAQKDPQQALV